MRTRPIFLLISVFFAINCQVKFLEEPQKMDFRDYLLYINGFLNGTQLSKVAPNIVGCDNSDTGLYLSINDFSLYFKNSTWRSQGVTVVLEEVSASFSYMFGNFSKIFHYCKVAPYDTVDIFKALGRYLSDPLTYITTFTKNLLSNPYNFYKEYIRSKMLLEQGNPLQAGQIIGELFASIFFPKLDYSLALFYLKADTSEFSEIEELFQCGISSLEISKKVVESVREFIRIFRRTGTFGNIYQNIKTIIGEGSASINSCLKTSVRIAKILLKIIFDRM